MNRIERKYITNYYEHQAEQLFIVPQSLRGVEKVGKEKYILHIIIIPRKYECIIKFVMHHTAQVIYLSAVIF